MENPVLTAAGLTTATGSQTISTQIIYHRQRKKWHFSDCKGLKVYILTWSPRKEIRKTSLEKKMCGWTEESSYHQTKSKVKVRRYSHHQTAWSQTDLQREERWWLERKGPQNKQEILVSKCQRDDETSGEKEKSRLLICLLEVC